MKIVPLDLETSGLNPEKDQILEIGMVIEDTEAYPLPPVEELPSFSMVVSHERIEGEPFALAMNADLIEKIKNGEGEDLDHAFMHMEDFLLKHLGFEPYVAAGKNVAGFDMRFFPPEIRRLFGHRVIDVGSVALGAKADFWKQKKPPSLGDLLEGPVAHTALEDARDVVRMLRQLTGNYGLR